MRLTGNRLHIWTTWLFRLICHLLEILQGLHLLQVTDQTLIALLQVIVNRQILMMPLGISQIRFVSGCDAILYTSTNQLPFFVVLGAAAIDHDVVHVLFELV